jgi:hypothetical protein
MYGLNHRLNDSKMLKRMIVVSRMFLMIQLMITTLCCCSSIPGGHRCPNVAWKVISSDKMLVVALLVAFAHEMQLLQFVQEDGFLLWGSSSRLKK